MYINNDNKINGLEGLRAETKAEFLTRIWNTTPLQMCLGQMVYNGLGAPVDYIILDVNQSFEQTSGLAREQAINKRITELNPYCDPRLIEKCGEAVHSGRTLIYAWHSSEPDLWREVQIFPLDSEERFITMAHDITGHMASEAIFQAASGQADFDDITERKKLEEALRESEERYRKLVKYAPALIYELDLRSKRFSFVNDLACELSGYSRSELLAMDPFDIIDDQCKIAYQTRYSQLLNGEEPAHNVEYKIKSKGGNVIDVLLNIIFEKDENGRTLKSTVIGQDITVWKKMEEALRESEQCLRTALEGAEAGMWVGDPSGKWVGTPQLNVLFGRSADGPPLRMDEYPSLIHPEDLLQSRQDWNRAIEEGGSYEQEYRVPQPDGSVRWLFSKGRVVNIAGSLPQFIGITYDITKRKQAEEVLKRGQQHLEELVRERTRELEDANRQNKEIAEQLTEITDNMIDIIVKVGTDGNIQYLSPSYEKIMGHGIEGRMGKSAFATIHPDDIERVTAAFQEGIEGKAETGIIQYRCRRADGGIIWLECTGKAVLDNSGAFTGAVLALRDITDHKTAEEALSQSEERFNKTFEASPLFMSVYSLDRNKYIAVNSNFEKIYGSPKEEIIGLSASDLNIWVYEKERDRFLDDIKKTGYANSHEISFRTKSGEIITLLVSGVVTKIDGESCVISTSIDISELRNLQKEITRLDRLHLVGEMAAGIGHEVRNPMTTIKGFLQLLGEKERYTQDRDYFELMVDELDRANSIISEFLSLAKNKAVDLEMRNLNKILKKLLPLIEADGLVTDKYIKLETKSIQDLMLDEKEIRQLVLNLVRNGLEAMSPGGTITIRTYTEVDKVVLAVQDSGKGIPPEVLEKIGTPFFTTKDTGTGLGLAVCYSIAARHNAKIDVETGSEGSTFFVRFRIPGL